MNSDEEAYNKFIVTSDDEEAEKENISAKKPKTSQQQFDLMTAFAKGKTNVSCSFLFSLFIIAKFKITTNKPHQKKLTMRVGIRWPKN